MRESMKKIWEISQKQHKALVQGLVFSFCRAVFGVTQIFSILTVIEVVQGHLAVKSGMFRVALLMFVCVLGSFVTSYVEQIRSMETGFFMTADKRVGIAGFLRKLPLGYFTESASEKVAGTLTTTLSGVETAAAMVMVGIVSGLFNSVTLFVFLLVYDWQVGLLMGVGMLAYLAVVNRQMHLSRKSAPAQQKAQTELAASCLNFLRGIKVTKAFCVGQGDQKLKQAVEDSCRENIRLTSVSMPLQFLASLTVAVFESGLLLFSLFQCFGQGQIDLTRAVLLLMFSFMAYASLHQAGSMLSMIGLLDTGLAEAARIEQQAALSVLEPQQTGQSQEIRLENVSFSYGEREVLHQISTVIRPRSLTAVIGPSGSGKTTLCRLIPRFQDVSAGRITIGGADIRHIPYDALMAQISMVFQNVYLFEDTILNNIRFGKPEATLAEVRAAAKAARCDEFIMALPDGYDTVVEEGGASLSGGEKQRISIARAILKDAPIILLDEATSALDAENEQEILAAINELTANKTVVMIAHRIQTVQKADHIIAMKDGRICQEGIHATLKDQPGLYRDFLQSREAAAGWRL